jgi:quercetin dioxygenase-like cupin family protein
MCVISGSPNPIPDYNISMAKAGDVLTNPDGERLTFLQTASDTNGDLLEMEVVYKPNSEKPPEHFHPNQEERFEVLAGAFRASIDGKPRVYEVGETFTVPPGAAHWMQNVSEDEGRMNWQTRPAMDTETFFETLWGLVSEGEDKLGGPHYLLQMAVVLRHFNRQFRLLKPAYWVQLIVFGTMALVGRLLGFRPRYERFSGEDE